MIVISLAYANYFSPLQNNTAITRMSNSDLELLYRAAYTMTFYSHEERYLDEMTLDMAALERRHSANTHDESEMFRSLVALRHFSLAKNFLSHHSNVHEEPLPQVINETSSVRQPSVLAVNLHKRELLHQAVLSPGPLHIVVVGHPLCHFTRRAVRAIENDPILFAAFKRYAIWIAPQDGRLDFDDFQQWNLNHPSEQMAIAYKEDEWPEIDDWETPTFYFFDGRTLIEKVVGWPGKGNKGALLDALRKSGMTR